MRKIVDFLGRTPGRARLAAFLLVPLLVVNHGVLGEYGNALFAKCLGEGFPATAYLTARNPG